MVEENFETNQSEMASNGIVITLVGCLLKKILHKGEQEFEIISINVKWPNIGH